MGHSHIQQVGLPMAAVITEKIWLTRLSCPVRQPEEVCEVPGLGRSRQVLGGVHPLEVQMLG